MGVLSAVAVAEIKARGSIKDADVLKLRRSYYDDGRISVDEAEILFALNDACPVQDPAWADCFIESITDYLVEQAEPHGYLTAENAAWLIERIAKDGQVESKTELELLVNVLDKARWAPQSLVRFALEQVKGAVLTGTGPLRSGKKLDAGIVTEADVDLLRRILYSFGSDGNVAITQPEAEVLFDIDAGDGGRRQPSGLDRSLRQGDRQLRDDRLQLRPSAARDCACPRCLARPARGPLPRQRALRHGHRLHRPVWRLSRAVGGRARGCPPGAAEDRDRHARSHHGRRGHLARRRASAATASSPPTSGRSSPSSRRKARRSIRACRSWSTRQRARPEGIGSRACRRRFCTRLGNFGALSVTRLPGRCPALPRAFPLSSAGYTHRVSGRTAGSACSRKS